MSNNLIKSIYDYPEFYPITSPGCEGDISFYVSEVKESGGPILEIGCGTGRILIPIAQQRIDVVGLDISFPMLETCRKNIKKYELDNVDISTGDMRSLDYVGQFNTVIMPYRTFLHLYTVDEQIKTLRGIYNALKSGGKFIFNIFDPEIEFLSSLTTNLSNHRLFRSGDIPGTDRKLVTWADTICDHANQIIDEIWTYDEIDDDSVVQSRSYGRFRIRYCFRYEVEHLLRRVDFKILNLYGGFDKSEYRYSREQIWVCQKQ